MASSAPSLKRRRLDCQQEDETATTVPQCAKTNDHQQDPTMHNNMPDRIATFKAMIENYTDGDLRDDNGTRRSYSHLDLRLQRAYYGRLSSPKRYQNEIKPLKESAKKDGESIEMLEDQRRRDQQRVACLEKRVAELEARIPPQVLTIANPSASVSVSVEPDDGDVIVVFRTAVEARCGALGLDVNKN
ncbi:hypothetical protein QBC40DRAFT_253010 [Triangularia verruculosa]|uniref:Uncharacterized protein n=1 Tax=Triangularia verruculosa TaxID=2587418 RepID=A0AAN6XIZ9_9PEZI|nr:hypothetical protein QBC40DRAFT_253010 [Triangularia verruculosa]